MKLFPCLLTLVVLFSSSVHSQEDCSCSLVESSRYPGYLSWDCRSRNLVEVPGGCFAIQSSYVAELLLSYNRIQVIQSTSLAYLRDLRLLLLDNNDINFVDPTAFDFLEDLEILDLNHNLQLTLDNRTFYGTDQLQVVSTVGTNLGAPPILLGLTELKRVDFRSSQLTVLPNKDFVDEDLTEPMLMNLNGNLVQDVAAQALLTIPDNSTVLLDDFIKVWAKDQNQKDEVLTKIWTVNIDLTTATKLCSTDGLPGDLSICY